MVQVNQNKPLDKPSAKPKPTLPELAKKAETALKLQGYLARTDDLVGKDGKQTPEGTKAVQAYNDSFYTGVDKGRRTSLPAVEAYKRAHDNQSTAGPKEEPAAEEPKKGGVVR